MAEDAESLKNKKIGDNECVKAIGNSWIICRSQSHSGRIYYFNTLTGRSAWNLSDSEIAKAQLLPREGASSHVGECPEPAEPPADTPHSSSLQNVKPKDAGARIYNKQIINNQFTKPYAIPAFQTNHCPYSSLNTASDTSIDATPVYNPAMWIIPPSHPVLLASAIPALPNQTQPIFNSPNIPVQNTFPNFFQIGNQSASQYSPHCQGFHQTNFKQYPERWKDNDLRNILRLRRKDQRSHIEEPEGKEAFDNHGNNYVFKNECEKSKLTPHDLVPSDVDDEWLEANTFFDISCAWKESSGVDCWIVVANTHVMLNNRKFLSEFIKPDEQIFLLTPSEVLKQLRSATGDTHSGSPLVQRARCALRFAAQQMDKVPAGLKNLQNRTIEKCCSELIEQNYHVLLLLDENELSSQINIDGVSTLTINQLKENLNQKFNTLKVGTQANITVKFCQNNGENKKTIGQSTQEALTIHHAENEDESSSIQHKEIEIQTEPIMSVKKTVDACIQTDFEISQTEIHQSPNSVILKSPAVVQPLNTGISKSRSFEESLKNDKILKTDLVVKSSNDNKEESEVATKKIRLKRNNLSTSHSPVKNPKFRWRKQRAKAAPSTTPSPIGGVVSNNQSVSTKSTPSSLISISDLLPLQNDNLLDLAKTTDFSDASIEKTHGEVSKVIEESSLDAISNSIDDDIILKVSKNAIFNESKDKEKEEIVMFEVTSDIMDDYLSRGCDEWLSRFVQIMEEALSQILQQEPCFSDPAMPPPWSVYEATVCIKRKFKENSKIVFACNECGTFLLKISDSRGKIFADLNPSDFMRLYSYGVYLIETLQSLLNDSEDLQIAMESLAKLLTDIKNPNLDVAQNVFIDTFLTEKKDHTANISEVVTDADAGDDLVDAAKISPPKTPQRSPCKPSPSIYNLRTSQRSNEQDKKGIPEDVSVQNMNTDESFFSSLRLQKTSSSTSILANETSPLSPQHTCPNHSLGGIKEDTKKNEVKIIRIANVCPEIEEKLKKSKEVKSSNETNGLHFEYDYTNDDNYYGDESTIDDNYYTNSTNKSDTNTQAESEDQYCTKLDIIGAQILKFVIMRTTYPVHRVLTDLHSFCEATCKELNSQEEMDQFYKTNLLEKTEEVRECLINLCNQLNSLLCRKDTKTKVRIMLEELGFMSCEINDNQVNEYGDLVQKYLDQANILFESVNLITAAIREKE